MEKKLSKRKQIGMLLCGLPLLLKIIVISMLGVAGLPHNSPTELKISALFLIPMFIGAIIVLTENARKEQSKINTFIFSVLGAMLAGFIGWIFWYF